MLETQRLLPVMSLKATACNAIQGAIGFTLKDTNLLLEALDTTGMRTSESNQRFAMLGDALLKLILLDGWYTGGTAKGSYTPKHQRRLSAVHVSHRAWQQFGLDHWQQCQSGHDRMTCRHRSACPLEPRTHR
jgi:hypothetical protein